MLPWILGVMMLVCGLVVIAFHQYWDSVAAIAISLFGWFVALRDWRCSWRQGRSSSCEHLAHLRRLGFSAGTAPCG